MNPGIPNAPSSLLVLLLFSFEGSTFVACSSASKMFSSALAASIASCSITSSLVLVAANKAAIRKRTFIAPGPEPVIVKKWFMITSTANQIPKNSIVRLQRFE